MYQKEPSLPNIDCAYKYENLKCIDTFLVETKISS